MPESLYKHGWKICLQKPSSQYILISIMKPDYLLQSGGRSKAKERNPNFGIFG